MTRECIFRSACRSTPVNRGIFVGRHLEFHRTFAFDIKFRSDLLRRLAFDIFTGVIVPDFGRVQVLVGGDKREGFAVNVK